MCCAPHRYKRRTRLNATLDKHEVRDNGHRAIVGNLRRLVHVHRTHSDRTPVARRQRVHDRLHIPQVRKKDPQTSERKTSEPSAIDKSEKVFQGFRGCGRVRSVNSCAWEILTTAKARATTQTLLFVACLPIRCDVSKKKREPKMSVSGGR